MEYKELRTKTVFDFCKDTKILEEITVFSKSEYLDVVRRNPIERARGLMDLAQRTKNKALEEAVKREFAKELDDYEAMFTE